MKREDIYSSDAIRRMQIKILKGWFERQGFL
jgi:hypothetical protein